MCKLWRPSLRVECDLTNGRSNYRWNAGPRFVGRRVVRGSGLAKRFPRAEYPRHTCESNDVTPLRDALGKGVQVVVHHRGEGLPELRQVLRVYDDKPFCSVQVEVVSATPLSSNFLAPLICDSVRTPDAGVHLDAGDKPRTCSCPSTTICLWRYNSDFATTSHEVTAIYDNVSRHGFVLGSLSHDVWKTGIEMGDHGPQKVGLVRVIGGMTGYWTHDSQPHGAVSGTTIPRRAFSSVFSRTGAPG